MIDIFDISDISELTPLLLGNVYLTRLAKYTDHRRLVAKAVLHFEYEHRLLRDDA